MTIARTFTFIAAVKGGALSPDTDANRAYYGQDLAMWDILFGHKVQQTDTGAMLANKIQGYSQIIEAMTGISKEIRRLFKNYEGCCFQGKSRIARQSAKAGSSYLF